MIDDVVAAFAELEIGGSALVVVGAILVQAGEEGVEGRVVGNDVDAERGAEALAV